MAQQAQARPVYTLPEGHCISPLRKSKQRGDQAGTLDRPEATQHDMILPCA